MAIKTIHKYLTDDNGSGENIVCPECGKEVCMRLFSMKDYSPVALLSKEDKDTSIAVCPCCSAIFSLNKNYLKEKSQGTFVTMTKEDLKVIVKGQ